MKVGIVTPRAVPFVTGGAERAWEGLRAALVDAGHDAEIVGVDVDESDLAGLSAAYRAFSELDVTRFDVVVSSKYPAWMVAHPRHVLWLFHPLRGLYDTYDLFGAPLDPGPVKGLAADLVALTAEPPRRDGVTRVLDSLDAALADDPASFDLRFPGPISRRVIRWLDSAALAPGEIARHTALSRTIAVRPGYLPGGVGAHIAHAPADVAVTAAAGESTDWHRRRPTPSRPSDSAAGPAHLSARPPDTDDDPGAWAAAADDRRHLFTTSRLDGPKRIDLVIEAMAHVPGDTPLLIGGDGPERERLEHLAAADPRITFLGRVDDEQLARLYADALAVPFVPLDEDYGLITVEAMRAGTPVVTVADSGGPTELIRDGVDGLITEPDAEALGAALADLVRRPDEARRLGEAGRSRAARITWPTTLDHIFGPLLTADGEATSAPTVTRAHPTGHPEPTRARRGVSRRPKVVVLTTFRVAERGHGGQLRSFHLYGALARHADVEIVSLTDGGPAGTTALGPGIVETAVPVSAAQRRAAEEMTLSVGLPVSDLAAGLEIERTPAYLRQLRRAARDADVVVLAEPYLYPALASAGVDLPFIYDAFNVEATLKGDVLPPTRAGESVLAQVVALENEVSRNAAAITACSRADASALARAGGRSLADVAVVPNGTDTAAYRTVSMARRRERSEIWRRKVWAASGHRRHAHRIPSHLAVFFGSWHPPNLDAARRVLDAAPVLPHVHFVLGGRHGDAFAGQTYPSNVTFTGVVSVAAKDALLGAADVALNPVMVGSGTNLKIIEYLAAGVPTASTEFGVRGLEATNGVHLAVSDDVITGVNAVLGDPERAASRAEAGRRLVVERYDWALLGDRLAEVVLRCVGSRA